MPIWRGDIARPGGFADAGRNYLSALATVGYTDIHFLHGYRDWRDPDFVDGGAYELLARTFAGADIRRSTQDTVITHMFPTDVHRFTIQGKRNVALTAWETDKLSADARYILDTTDEIWVPSTHNEAALRASGVRKPIFVVPHCHGPWALPAVPTPKWREGRYVFYTIGSDNARKNPQAVLRAFVEEFAPDEPVALIYKVWSPIVWNQQAQAGEIVPAAVRVRRVLRETQRPQCAPVIVATGAPPMNDILKLHAWGDCFVSAHRGEAWGLAISQAKWFGRKVIATGWSGPIDYLDPRVDDLLPYDLVPVDPVSMGFRPGFTIDQRWAQVNEDALREAMRRAFESRATGSDVGMDRFSWAAVGVQMAARLRATA